MFHNLKQIYYTGAQSSVGMSRFMYESCTIPIGKTPNKRSIRVPEAFIKTTYYNYPPNPTSVRSTMFKPLVLNLDEIRSINLLDDAIRVNYGTTSVRFQFENDLDALEQYYSIKRMFDK